ncbi:MAG: hypothetical protein QGM45_12075 [Anaerolineales bacterium]|nr:hypothetical protein [Anaerolineales bacterium]
MTKSDNEAWFLTQWKRLGGPEPETEYRFHDKRKWRFDFCWPDRMTALEVEGLGHAHWNRYHGDVEKYNAATLLGWRVLRLTFHMIRQDDLTLLDSLMGVLSDGKSL